MKRVLVSALAAGFQMAVVESLIDRTRRAIAAARASHPSLSALVVAGGVAANGALRSELEACARQSGLAFVAPPLRLCTDNAAMIASAARYGRPLEYPRYLALDAYASIS